MCQGLARRRKRKFRETLDHASPYGDNWHIPEGVHEGVYRRAVKNKWGTVTHYKYEPRFKPPRERLETGSALKFNCLPLGGYSTLEEAKIVRQIAAFFYGKGKGSVQLEDGLCIPVPSVGEQEKCPPSGKEKADWVARETKAVYAFLSKDKARKAVHLENPGSATGSQGGHDRDVTRRDSSPSTDMDAPSSPGTYSTAFGVVTSRNGGNGVGQRTAPKSSRSPAESIPAAELFSDLLSSHDLEPLTVSWKETDVPATDDHAKIASDDSNTAYVCGFESVIPLFPQPSTFAATPLQLDGGAQGSELVESLLNPATMVTFHQMESVPGEVQLQQLVTCQKRHLTEFAGWNVQLQQMLCDFEVQKLNLQQKLAQSDAHNRGLQLENERLKTTFQQVAKLTFTCNLVGNGS